MLIGKPIDICINVWHTIYKLRAQVARDYPVEEL